MTSSPSSLLDPSSPTSASVLGSPSNMLGNLSGSPSQPRLIHARQSETQKLEEKFKRMEEFLGNSGFDSIGEFLQILFYNPTRGSAFEWWATLIGTAARITAEKRNWFVTVREKGSLSTIVCALFHQCLPSTYPFISFLFRLSFILSDVFFSSCRTHRLHPTLSASLLIVLCPALETAEGWFVSTSFSLICLDIGHATFTDSSEASYHIVI